MDWKVVDIEGGHEAFMTKPGALCLHNLFGTCVLTATFTVVAEIAKIIIDAAKSWS